jgi:DNA-binding SARP family transcriptional activator/tetratricopeptide (TPR) repeat protein/DNA-binding transcriptional ArsR family regulator
VQTLEVSLFGGFQLRRGDRSVPPMPSRAARTLFAYLAVDRGTRHPRERLASLFWPDLPANRARRRLSHTLWQVQDALHELEGDATYLEVTADTLAFAPDAPCTVDVEAFEAGLEQARSRRGGRTQRVRDLTDLEATVELYRGEFLAGHTDDWVAEVQERLHQAYVEALGWLVGLAKSHGAFEDALVYARRLTNEDPLREDGHREVMRLSVLLDRPNDAVRQYERCRDVLADELGTTPSAATEDLFVRIERQQRLAQAAPAESGSGAGPLADRLPLIGRERERDTGITVLERALAGRGGGLLVEGDPGVGTSRLLAEIADDAGWRAFSAIQVACPSPEHAMPYGVVGELLAAAITPLRLEQLRPRVAPVWLAEAATLVPVLARAVPAERVASGSLRSEESAQRMRDALTQVLLGLAAIEPLALVVDDAHWSDVESLSVLESVAEHLVDRPAVLVLGYRGDDARATADVWAAIRGIDRRARPERLVLGPLDAFSTGELIRVLARGQVVGPGAIARLQRETGGNPLFVVEMVRALAEDELLHTLDDGGGDAEVPVTRSIRELALHRLDRLSREAREVLDVAAVAGGELDLEVLAAASELPREVVVDAAGLLVRRSLLAETPEAFVFRHEVVRRVAVDALTTPGRRALHHRIAEVLEEREPDAVERLAHHFLHADLPGRAAGYLHRAGRNAAAVHAYATADQRYRLAIEHGARGPVSITRRSALLAEHETVLDVLGERERQLEVLEELAVLAEGTPEREVEVARRRALLSGHLGDLAVGLAAAQQAVAGAESLDDETLLGPALVAHASVLAWAGRRSEAVPVLERAVGVAVDSDVGLQAQVQLGSVLRELQRYNDAEAVLEDVLGQAELRGAARDAALALGVLGVLNKETGDSEMAIERYGQAIARSVAIGFRRGEGVNLVNRAVAHWARSELVPALADFEAAASVFAGLRDRRGEAAVRANLGFVLHAVSGDDTAAGRHVEHALSYYREINDVPLMVQCLDTLASVALRKGNHRTVARFLDEASRAVTGSEEPVESAEVLIRRRRASLALARGRPGEAHALAQDAVTMALEHGLDDLLPVLRGLLGETLIASGRGEEALTVTAAAVAGLHAGVEQAYLVRFQHSLALEAVGRREAALRETEQAHDELEAILVEVDPDARERSLALPEHRRILTALARALHGRVSISVAAADAPLGRPLRLAEHLEVVVDRSARDDDPDDPVDARRTLLARVVAAIGDQGGAPTIGNLAEVLEVSPATVRRDLGALRDAGVAVETRGHRSG